jgi:hypothetical protein
MKKDRDFAELRAPLSGSTINEKIKATEYAVRGEIVVMAQRIAKELEEGPGRHPFDKLVWCNIGNPQLLAQVSSRAGLCTISFHQVASLLPFLPPSISLAEAHHLLPTGPGSLRVPSGEVN